MTDAAIDALIRLHAGLPRQGPGDLGLLDRLLDRLDLPPRPVVADLGCGSGLAARHLAQVRGARVLAVDAAVPFVAQIEADLAASPPASGSVEPRVGDMLAPGVAPGSLDLVVSEGAAYAVGVARALEAWRPLVRPGGACILSECVWFGQDRPAEAAAYWGVAYPAMGTTAATVALAEASGWRLRAAERLPAAAWWLNYYGPLAEACDRLAAGADPALAEAIAESRQEMALFRRFSDHYGYVVLALDTPA